MLLRLVKIRISIITCTIDHFYGYSKGLEAVSRRYGNLDTDLGIHRVNMGSHAEDLAKVVAKLTSSDVQFKAGCKKCGFPGHLTYQCRNFIKSNPASDVIMDVSSTTSLSSEEEFVSPLKKLAQEELKAQQKEVRKRNKKKRKLKKFSSDDESDEGAPEARSRSRKHVERPSRSPHRRDPSSVSRSRSESPGRFKSAKHKKSRSKKKRSRSGSSSRERSKKKRTERSPSSDSDRKRKHKSSKSKKRQRSRTRSRSPRWKSSKWLENFLKH
ncbi:protein SREK1IP1-like [Paramacrobiotus metropolitanus]|uniref:protein SREK1IP1-like n=1 Tax=Paramacrobiotus metropolitanus TaxID=2943436 RepID=UPI002445BBB7|nr:protein SREK1IP1-like [Paramacrobiotus metropolitanus]